MSKLVHNLIPKKYKSAEAKPTARTPLAELADEMKMIIMSAYYVSGRLDASETRMIDKARRIISELARVEDKISSDDHLTFSWLSSIWLACRAIAGEETGMADNTDTAAGVSREARSAGGGK